MFILSKRKNLIFTGIFCLGGVAYLGLPAVLKQSLYLNRVGCYPVVTGSSCSQNMGVFCCSQSVRAVLLMSVLQKPLSLLLLPLGTEHQSAQ